MQTEIVAIGSELISGSIIDTNSSYIASRLISIGIMPTRISVIPDDKNQIKNTIKESIKRSNIIIVTGGLGPTKDDLTKEVVCKLINRKLYLDKNLLRNIRKRYPKCIFSQAIVPENSIIIENEIGTAPGIIIVYKGKNIILLPGVPQEMKHVFDKVIPYIRSKSNIIIKSKEINTFGIPESKINRKINKLFNMKNVNISLLPTHAYVKIRITVYGKSYIEVDKKIIDVERKIRKQIGEFIFSENDESLESIIGKLLTQNNLTISVAESCTGGLISHRITNVPGSSKYFKQGLTTYSNESKIELLNVPKEVIEKYGAVSSKTAKYMAEGVRKLAKSNIGISVTGIAGPTGATKKKPVGLVYIGLSDNKRTIVKKYIFSGTREIIKEKSASSCLFLLFSYLRTFYFDNYQYKL